MNGDWLLQETLSSAFVLQGFEVETASDGLNALWRIREGGYDLVLCDYRLPEINGLAMARLTRELMNAIARPVLIALTGSSASLMDREAPPESAFDEIVAKPVDLHRLIAIVQRHLDARADIMTRRKAEFRKFSENCADDADPGSTNSQEGRPSPRILVVEDDEMQRSVLKSVLEAYGFTVEVAVDGFQAFRIIRDCIFRDRIFDLAVFDYQLPEVDGLATGRLISSFLKEDVRPRMIAFTAAPDHLAGRLAGDHGVFDEIVAKSAGLSGLLATVGLQLRSSPRATTRRAAEVVFPFAT